MLYILQKMVPQCRVCTSGVCQCLLPCRLVEVFEEKERLGSMLAMLKMSIPLLALAFQHIDLNPLAQGLWPFLFFTAARRSEIPPLSANVACQRTLDRMLENIKVNQHDSSTHLVSTYNRILAHAWQYASSLLLPLAGVYMAERTLAHVIAIR